MKDITVFKKRDESLVDLLVEMLSYCDGETVEYALRESGKDEQAMKQLLRNRMQFIQEDVDKCRKYLEKSVFKTVIDNCNDEGNNIFTFLSNIEIASDLEDNESNDWKLNRQ